MKTTTKALTKIELSLEEEKTLEATKNILEAIMKEGYELGEFARFSTSIGEEFCIENLEETVQMINTLLDVDIEVALDDEN